MKNRKPTAIVLLPGDGDETGNRYLGAQSFEEDMPAIAKWFAENLPKDARP